MYNVITLTTFGHLVLVLSVHFIVEVSQRKFSGLRFLMILAKSMWIVSPSTYAKTLNKTLS